MQNNEEIQYPIAMTEETRKPSIGTKVIAYKDNILWFGTVEGFYPEVNFKESPYCIIVKVEDFLNTSGCGGLYTNVWIEEEDKPNVFVDNDGSKWKSIKQEWEKKLLPLKQETDKLEGQLCDIRRKQSEIWGSILSISLNVVDKEKT